MKPVDASYERNLMPIPETGKKAPQFTLPDSDSEKISLKNSLGRYVVLFFYPKDLTPGCTTESCDFRDYEKKFSKLNCQIFGISRDSVERHVKFRDKYSLNFPLLSDEAGKVCEKYGVWQEKKLYGKSFMGIVRTTFLIDEKGKIIKIYPKVKVKEHVDKVFNDLKDHIKNL